MTRRLAVLYALSASVVLIGTAAVANWWLARELRTEDVDALGGRLAELRDMVRADAGVAAIQGELAREAVAMRPGRFIARIRTATGRVIVQSPDMPTALSSGAFPAVDRGERSPRVWRARDGTFYLLMAGVSARPLGEAWVIEVALDRTTETRISRAFRNGLLVAVGLGVLVLSGLGWLVARRALAPLDELTTATAGVVATRLHRRLGERSSGRPWPHELFALRSAFDEMLGRLEESFGRLQQFSADLAHELRTPMARLRGEAEVALGRERTVAEYRTVLESALEEYDRLSSMIESLLFLARAESGRAALARVPVQLREEVATAVDFYEALAEHAGVTVTIDGAATVAADPAMVRHAVGNLLANALRHTAVGGTVVVAIEPTTTGTWLRVSDTGEGIAPEDLPRVFDRFFRADRARTSAREAGVGTGAHEGAGLGLALVKSIAELHGGRVEVVSVVDSGTTVSIWFPTSP